MSECGCEERRVLLCQPNTSLPLDDAYQWRCTDCPQRLWVSVVNLASVTSGWLTPLCIPCARRQLRRLGEVHVRLLPEQEGYLAEAGLLGEVRKRVLMLNNGKLSLQSHLDYLEAMWR